MLKTSLALIAVCFTHSAFATSQNRNHEIEAHKISGFCNGRAAAVFRWQRMNGVRVVKIQESSHLIEIPAAEALKSGCGTENSPIDNLQDPTATVTTDDFSEGADSAS